MYHILCTFLIYSFLGWCVEVSYFALVTGRFVNRGFLNGPVCPIYGFGVVIVFTCLDPLQHNLLLLFLGSVVLTSLLELVTGFVLEKLFHQRWWDYTGKPFNLHGYICLQFSIAWGIACLIVVDIVRPTVDFAIDWIPKPVGWVLIALFGAIMLVDLILTVSTIAKLNRRLVQIDELSSTIKHVSDEFGEGLADKVLEAAEVGSDLKSNLDGWTDSVTTRMEGLEASLRVRKAELQDDLTARKEELQDGLNERKAELQDNLAELRDDVQQRRSDRRAQREARRADMRQQLLDSHAKLHTLLEQDSPVQTRLLNAFPDLRSTDHAQAMEQLRRRHEARHKCKSGK
jgi:uncharacterized membrane protein